MFFFICKFIVFNYKKYCFSKFNAYKIYCFVRRVRNKYDISLSGTFAYEASYFRFKPLLFIFDLKRNVCARFKFIVFN